MVGTALVVGASGIVGGATASLLVERGWNVHGLSRRPAARAGIIPVAADLQDAEATAFALAGLRADAVFITTWLRQDSEAENIRVNAAMVHNLLDELRAPMWRHATSRLSPVSNITSDRSRIWAGRAAADPVP